MSLNTIEPATEITTSDFSDFPAIAGLADGDFVVVYTELTGDFNTQVEIVSKVFDPQGQTLATGTVTEQFFDPIILYAAGLSGSGFALAWDGDDFLDSFGNNIGTGVFTDAATALSYTSLASTELGANEDPILTPLANASGGYAVSWLGTGGDLWTVSFDAQGNELAAPVDLSGTSSGIPHGASQADGGYALAWDQAGDPTQGINGGIYFTAFDAQGQEIGTPTFVGPGGGNVAIAALSDGDYALAYTGFNEFSQTELFTAIYDGSGQQVAAPALIGGIVGWAQIATLANGNYALSWEDNGGHIDTAVYNGQGQQVSAPLDVSQAYGTTPQIATLSNGDYALAWVQEINGIGDIYTAVCNAQGQEVVAPVDVSNNPVNYDGFNGYSPQLTALANGAYAIMWQSPEPSDPLFNDLFTAVYQDTAVTASVTYIGTSELQLDLSSIFNVGGDVTISSNDQLVSIDLSNLLTVGGNLTLSNNGALLTITLPNLTSVGGNLAISGDTAATIIDLGSLTTASGSVDISGDTAAAVINVGSLTTASGSVDISGDMSVTSISAGSLATASGSVDVSGDSAATVIDLGSLTTASGSVDISGDTAATVISVGSLTTVSGNVDISGDTSVTSISAGSLTTASGSVSLIGNTAAITIDLSALIQAGALIVSQNGIVTINLGALITAGGDVALTDNSQLLTVDLPNLGSVDGNVAITGDTSATTANLGSLTTTGGDLTISGDTSATTVDVGSLTTTGGDLTISGDTSATTVDVGSLTTTGGDLTISGDSSATTVDVGSLTTTGGDLIISGDTSATTVNLGSADTVGGDVTISSGADAKLDAGALGPGGGTLKLIGDNLTTTVILGSLDHMQGTLTVTSADGVTLTAKAELGALDITGTAADDTLIGSATANNNFDARGGNDTMTGGAGDDTYRFDLSVSQHTEEQDVSTTVHHHDFVDLGRMASVTVGGVTYDRPAVTASITAWKNWNNELTTWAGMQSDNTGGDDFASFTNQNPANAKGAGKTVGTIQLIDGYYHDYDTTTVEQQLVTVSDLSGDSFDTIFDFSHVGLPVSNAGDDALIFHGLSSNSAALNYWGAWLDSTAANGDTTIHFHDVANRGADISAITLKGVTTDVAALVNGGAILFA